jgi:hypothetical protein
LVTFFAQVPDPIHTDEPLSSAEFVTHDEFRAGLPAGRFRIVVDPRLARRYVTQRLHLLGWSVAATGVGIALALGGQPWPGAALVFGAIVVKRVVQARAAAVLLQLALRDPAVYYEAATGGVLEVQRSS